MITRKTAEQIALMRRAGKVVAEMHEVCIRATKPGATTADLDRAAREVLDDGWTVVTRDGRRSAHFEHTIAVTDHGPEVLTLPW